MDDGNFDIEIDPGQAWAVFNLRTGVSGGTRIGLTRTDPLAPDEDGSDG